MIGRVNVAGRGEGPAPGPAYSVEKWCKVVGLTYSDISDISEPNMRILMSKHTSVDYFMEWYNADNSMLDDFTQSEIAMKWIGLNDYIADKLLAISDAESRLLASEFWEYILKDHVPIMTANDAPYGKVDGSNKYSSDYDYYKAFGGSNVVWLSSYRSTNLTSPIYVQYSFTNPICIKRIAYQFANHGVVTSANLKLEVSNDNSTWESLDAWSVSKGDYTERDISNDAYFLHIRFSILSGTMSSGQFWGARNLQFYGRSLNVSVPTMASNTQPYGEVIYNGESYPLEDKRYPYKAFNKIKDDPMNACWLSTDGTMPYLGYDFKKDIVLKFVCITLSIGSVSILPNSFQVETSTDGEHWNPFGDVLTQNVSDSNPRVLVVTNAEGVNCHMVRVITTQTTGSPVRSIMYRELEFFGVDYSDRTERTYLYDHGLKLIPMSMGVKGAGDGLGTVTENALSVTCACTDALYKDQAPYATESPIDIAPYSSVFARYEKGYSVSEKALVRMSVSQTRAIWSSDVSFVYDILQKAPYGMLFIDASNINDSKYIIVGSMVNSDNGGACSVDFTEIWLE